MSFCSLVTQHSFLFPSLRLDSTRASCLARRQRRLSSASARSPARLPIRTATVLLSAPHGRNVPTFLRTSTQHATNDANGIHERGWSGSNNYTRQTLQSDCTYRSNILISPSLIDLDRIDHPVSICEISTLHHSLVTRPWTASLRRILHTIRACSPVPA